MSGDLLALASLTAANHSANHSAGRSLAAATPHATFHGGTFCLGHSLAPAAFLLGCQRCGTGSLYEDIMTHVQGARRGHALHGEPDYYGREQHFFATDSWSHGVHHYLDHFPACPGAHADLSFVVDATPAYLRKPIVATRLKSLYPAPALPRLRFLVILRDPARRLHAYWDTFVLAGTGVNNFAAWVETTLGKVLVCQRQHGPALWPPPDEGRCDTDTIEGVAAGLYSYQLTYWFREFSPSQFFLTSLDAYERDTATVVREVAAFLGAPRGLMGTPRAIGAPVNPQAVKVLGAMPDRTREALGQFYRPHNARVRRSHRRRSRRSRRRCRVRAPPLPRACAAVAACVRRHRRMVAPPLPRACAATAACVRRRRRRRRHAPLACAHAHARRVPLACAHAHARRAPLACAHACTCTPRSACVRTHASLCVCDVARTPVAVIAPHACVLLYILSRAPCVRRVRPAAAQVP